MSKLNPVVKSKSKSKNIESTISLAGGFGAPAAKQSNAALLRRLVLANLLWEDMAYVDGKTASEQISELIAKVEPSVVAELAIEAREEQKLRHLPLFLCAEMLKHPATKDLVKDILPRIITRPDMITDFLSIYKKLNGKLKPLASSAKKGLAKSFNNFNEYQFGKYDRDSEIKLRDAMFLVHPTPEQGKEELFKAIAERTLKTPDTWEVALSAGKDKKETWTRLISEGKLGALAFLRNLRNMKEAGVDHNVIRQGFKTIKSQMLLPINFISAAEHAPEFKSDINEMMLRVYSDLSKLPGYSIFVIDVSGSMGCAISAKSSFSRMKQAFAMAILAAELCEKVDIYLTAGSDSARGHATEIVKYPKRGFDLMDQMQSRVSALGGGGIFTRQCLDYIKTQTKGTPDRIMIFSDSQDCDSNRTLKPSPFAKNNYIVDVSAHKNGVNYKGIWTAEISGWSEHFLNYIAAYEGVENSFENE